MNGDKYLIPIAVRAPNHFQFQEEQLHKEVKNIHCLDQHYQDTAKPSQLYRHHRRLKFYNPLRGEIHKGLVEDLLCRDHKLDMG